MNDSLPCLDLLEETPAILHGLMSEISKRMPAGSRRRTVSRSRRCSPIFRIRKVTATGRGWTAS